MSIIKNFLIQHNDKHVNNDMSNLPENSNEVPKLIFCQFSDSSISASSLSDDESLSVSHHDDQETLVFYGFPLLDEKPDELDMTATDTIPIIDESSPTEIILEPPTTFATPGQTFINRCGALSDTLCTRFNITNITTRSVNDSNVQHMTEEGHKINKVASEIQVPVKVIPLRFTSRYKLLEIIMSKEFITFMDLFFMVLIKLYKQMNENENSIENDANICDRDNCMHICLYTTEILMCYSDSKNDQVGRNQTIKGMDDALNNLLKLILEVVESVEAVSNSRYHKLILTITTPTRQ